MPSKKLYFNRTLFRKNLTRFWPLWAMPSFLSALFPMVALTELLRSPNTTFRALDVTSAYYDVVTFVVPIVSLCYAVLVALAVWSYLFNNRSVGLMHTLPIRREGLFFTSLLSGMAMMLIPYAITGTLAILVFACFGAVNPGGILVTILCVAGESLFYFATATLVAFITGNLFAMPALYFIFHFLAVGLDALLAWFARGFLMGITTSYSGAAEWLSPTVYLMRHVSTNHEYLETFVPDTIHGSMTPDGMGYYSSQLVSVTLENGWIIAAYTLAGVAALALALVLYRRRRSECAGDVVAVGWMKPLFRYGVALCGALAGGLALYSIFWHSFHGKTYYSVVPLAIYMMLAGAIAYYAASMLLSKSLRVFRGSGKGLLCVAVCVAAVCGVLRFDLLGIERRVPAAEEIESLYLRAANNGYTLTSEEHPEVLEQVLKLHKAVVADKDYIVAMDEGWLYADDSQYETVSTHNYIRLEYTLKNGKTLSRRYYVPLTRERMQQSGTYDYLLNTLINSETMKSLRLHLSDGYTAEGGWLWLETRDDSVDLSSREAAAVLEAVGRDMAEGNWGEHDWFGTSDGDRYAIGLELEFEKVSTHIPGQDSTISYDHISITLRPRMTHTVSCLTALGFVQAEDLVTYDQLKAEESDEGLAEITMTEDSFPRAAEIIGISDTSTSIVVQGR